MSVYEYITKAYGEDQGKYGAVARELLSLAEHDESVKSIDTFYDFVTVIEKVHNPVALEAMTESFFCECCTACGIPIT